MDARMQGISDGQDFVLVVQETIDLHRAFIDLVGRMNEPGVVDCILSQYHLGYGPLLAALASMEGHGADPPYLEGFAYGYARAWWSLEQSL